MEPELESLIVQLKLALDFRYNYTVEFNWNSYLGKL